MISEPARLLFVYIFKMFQFEYKCCIIVFVGLVTLAHSQTVDETLLPRSKGSDVAEAVVRKIQRSGIFPHDQSVLRRLAFVESRDGENITTFRPDYFGGIWQLDEDRFSQTKNVAGLNTIYQNITDTWNIQWNTVTWEDLLKPFYSGLGVRLLLHYLALNDIPIPGTIDSQADYWKANYRPDQSVTLFTEEVKRLESDGGVCEGLMDFCIVLDGSGSIGPIGFFQAKRFVAELVQSFSLDSTRVAFVLYSDNAVKIFDFNDNLSATEMNITIHNAQYPSSNTNTPGGLLMAVEFYNSILIPRPGVPKVVATFTDGEHNRGNLPTAIMAVRNANLTSFAVGIGNEAMVRESELRQIALEDPSRVFRVNDYASLVEFFYQMNKVTCEVPQEPEIGENQNGSLSKNEKRYFKFQIPSAGFTLTLSTTNGQLSGWYSYTEKTPSSALYDGLLSNVTTFIQGIAHNLNSEVYITIQCNAEGGTEYIISTMEGQQTPATTTTPMTTPVTTDPDIFTCLNRPDGMYPHPYDCAKFINCRFGNMTEFICPHPLLFDPVTRTCNIPEEVDCQISCSQRPNGVYPHPHASNLFIGCVCEVVSVYICPAPLLFDPTGRRCDVPDFEDCQSK